MNLVEGYQEWMCALNYSTATIYHGGRMTRDFLEWLNSQKIMEIQQVTKAEVELFFDELSNRRNKNTGRGLSLNYLHGYRGQLRRFSRYLVETGQGHLDVSLDLDKAPAPVVIDTLFTKEEIEDLYEAVADDLLGMRDRAMLSIYYGCGLRLSEGLALNVRDIQLDRGIIHVQKGKNYRERYVPMVGRVEQDLREYLEYARPNLANYKTGDHFFVNYRGGRVGKSMMPVRLNQLKEKARLERPGSLHALRHSIATHLLAGGMSLDKIASFLGHQSLESTQIYTHLLHELG